MDLLFSLADFLNVFKDYNHSIFPLQIVFYFAAFLCIYFLFTGNNNATRIISITLAFLWLWMGVVYHIIFFSEINKAAYIFGGLFILQGVMFAGCGLIRKKLSFEYTKSAANNVGIVLIAYALIIYPVLGTFLGHAYPYSPTFGLPCPTTIFTFGILLFANQKMPVHLLIIPLLWSVIGFTAALNLTIYEDIGLLLAGVTAFVLLIISNRKFKSVGD
ncbi:MAG: hypothetical protein IH618_02495 [Ignavibacteriaceae bacterium]|nr:hypothetical protein [Ignavibacteriaceae bacterium]